jgi:hypothetical protein
MIINLKDLIALQNISGIKPELKEQTYNIKIFIKGHL